MISWKVVVPILLVVLVASFPAASLAGQPAQVPDLEDEGWVNTGPAAVRLISERSAFSPTAAAAFGVQIKMRPGWWTYWRAPGEMGMPPEFDWSGSQNLKWTPELFWPKPVQKTSFGHNLRVYRDQVVFPVRAVAADPRKPLTLKLNLTFGVCKEVCIPNLAAVTLTIPPESGNDATIIAENRALIRQFASEVPGGNAQRSGFRIQNVGLIADSQGRKSLAVELSRLSGAAQPLVLIELSPDEPPLIAKSLGQAANTGAARFAAELDGGQTATKTVAGRRVRVTILDGGRSLEQTWVVGVAADSSGRFGSAAPGRQIADPLKPRDDPWKPQD